MTRAKLDDFDIHVERMLAADPWTARVAEHNWLRRGIRIAYGKDLFASGGLDNGTERLLRVLAKPDSILRAADDRKLRILDVGCGAGALGISLARGLGPEKARVVLSDRDRLAVWFARQNAKLNGVDDGEHGDVSVLDAGLGHDAALAAGEKPFDVIVSNVPASIGDDGLYDLIYGAGPLLAKGGCVAFVYVIPLDETMTAMRLYHEKTYGPVEVVVESRGKEHVAQVLRFPTGLPEFESDDPLASWKRADIANTIDLGETRDIPWCAVHDVPEFDTPHFETGLIARLIEDARPAEERSDAENLLLLNPRHGMLGGLLIERRHPKRLALLSRDTLEVEVASRNLKAFLAALGREQETEIVAAPAFPERPWLPLRAPDAPRYDLIVGHLNWREGLEALSVTLRSLQSALSDDGIVVVACRSGQIEGLRHAAHGAGLRDGRTFSRKGHTAIVLKLPRRADRPAAES